MRENLVDQIVNVIDGERPVGNALDAIVPHPLPPPVRAPAGRREPLAASQADNPPDEPGMIAPTRRRSTRTSTGSATGRCRPSPSVTRIRRRASPEPGRERTYYDDFSHGTGMGTRPGPSGTGAEMRPLDTILREPEPAPDLALVRRKPQPRPEREPEPRKARRFKVVDVMTGAVMAEDVGTRATVDLLGEVRRVGDVRIHVWSDDAERWRLLTLAEQRKLWDLRGR